MFKADGQDNNFRSALGMMDLIYHSTVRHVRRNHRNALAGLALNILQTVIFVAAFYMMFAILGLRGNAIRGDFLLYLLSGIFLFLTHTKAVAAVMNAEGPASQMMKHAPMNTAVAIMSSALSSLYLQALSAIIILFAVHVAWQPIVIDEPIGTVAMFLLAWLSGVAIGLLLFAIKPWFPEFATLATTIYSRVNMIASGKMFVANTLPGSLLAFFDWNPLFHCIDQARGFTFINYNPHFSSISYPVYVTIALIMIGLLAEFYTRKRASISWSAGR